MKSVSLLPQILLHSFKMLPQREFKQARAAATYEALLAAAARVFGRRGFDAAQTPEIAAEAGVSTGAFYRYFTDKRAIFLEVIAQHLGQSHDSVMAKLTPDRFVGQDIRKTIDGAIDVLFDRIVKDAPLERVFLAMSFSDPDVRRMRAESESQACKALAELIEHLVPKSRVRDAMAAARVISIAAVELAGDRAELRPRVADDCSDAALKEALREMVYRYLFAPEGSEAYPDESCKATTTARPRRRKR
jgi:AcrR family transcriptional regulator